MVQKGESAFSKPLDMAIVVRNREGETGGLVWGEVFYRNPADIVVAFQTEPVMPLRDCAACHPAEVYRVWHDPLKRKVGLPRLVVANDFYTERSLENVTSIEVVDLHFEMPVKRMKELFAPDLTVVQEPQTPADRDRFIGLSPGGGDGQGRGRGERLSRSAPI